MIVNESKLDILKEHLLGIGKKFNNPKIYLFLCLKNSNPEHLIPIGFIYIQLPLQQRPRTIWPNYNWTDISAEYSGLFFRPLRGNSSRLEEIQEVNGYPVRLDLIVSGGEVRPRNQAIRIWKRIQ